jgi:hypothetical protein
VTQRRVVLFDGELQPGTSSYVEAYINDAGDLVLESVDTGDLSREFWGDSDYEWWITVRAPERDALLTELHTDLSISGSGKAASKDELLSLLERKYGGNRSASFEFQRWLDEHGIPYEFFSYA